ncbi:N-acetylglucosamine kinase [Pseudothermotoga sp. U03pept]|uniref:N-acetylglucosamine kinase n=1 Tax=Pseudothermotoga sp. U03pept TaxID=3447012 RepID=UPI003EFFDA38
MRFLGVDAGGTKTRVALCDERGEVLSKTLGGPANHLDIGIGKLKRTLQDCLNEINEDIAEVDLCVLGLSGAGFSQKSCDRLRDLMAPVVPSKRLIVVNDCILALRGALGTSRKSGTIVVAGTGSMVIGVDVNGNFHRTGGWGHIIGDSWSAYGLAFDSIKEVMKYWEGRGKPTSLVCHVEKVFDLHSIDDVLRYFYVEKHPKSHLASFAPFVLRCAEEGDEVAQTVVKRCIAELVDAVEPVLKRVGSDFLSYTGGLFNNSYFLRTVENSLQDLNVNFTEPSLPPLGGALLMAMEQFFTVKEEVEENLKRQLSEEGVH